MCESVGTLYSVYTTVQEVGLIKPATPLNWLEQIRHILYLSSILCDRYTVFGWKQKVFNEL
jgi:hypothetical protein